MPHEMNLGSLTSHWKRRQSDCAKFVGVLAEAQRMTKSGQNEDDVMKQARDLFNGVSKGKKDFVKWNLDHAFKILRKYPKWQVGEHVHDSGSSKRSEPNTRTSDDGVVRPEGVKKSKRRAYSSSETESNTSVLVASFNNWSINNRDGDIQRNAAQERMLQYMEKQESIREERRQKMKEESCREKEEQQEKECYIRFEMWKTLFAKDESKLKPSELTKLMELN